jgi:hypothetical protein
MNKNDIVRKVDLTKAGGKVRYVCCINSTRAGNGTCDKKTCVCPVRDFCFVEWPATSGGGTFSCPDNEIELDPAAQPQQVQPPIGIALPDDETIDAEQVPVAQDTIPTKSLAEQEKELAARLAEIRAATKGFDFDGYYGITRPDGKSDRQISNRNKLV